MKNKLVLLLLLLTMTAMDTLSQLPSQTVVFKVRKVDKQEEIRIEAVQTEYDPPFITVETNATFRGGDVNTFRTWVQQSINIVYPPAAGTSGKVFIQFCVNSRGQVCDIQVLRGVHPEIDQEVVRCMNSSPAWIPAKQGGKAVKQQFVMPVMVSLQNDEK
jgi:periplasmic protein TonB